MMLKKYSNESIGCKKAMCDQFKVIPVIPV